MTMLHCACGSPDWIAASPGTIEITTGDDPNVLLLKPIPAVPSAAWCIACWPWGRRHRQGETAVQAAHVGGEG